MYQKFGSVWRKVKQTSKSFKPVNGSKAAPGWAKTDTDGKKPFFFFGSDAKNIKPVTAVYLSGIASINI